MLNIGDKIKCVKANPLFSFPVGTTFEVTDIQGTIVGVVGVYKTNGIPTGQIRGVMSYDEYEKYFEKYEEKNVKSEYTNWETVDYCGRHGCDCEECPYNLLCSFQQGNSQIQVKHNNKKVAIKAQLFPNESLYPYAPEGKVLTVYTTRHPDDEFDLDKALEIGFARLHKAIAKQTIKMANKNIAQY